MPRTAKLSENAGPANSLMLRRDLPSLWKTSNGSLISYVRRVLFDLFVGVSVGYKQIRISVVIIVKKFCAPTAHQSGNCGDSQRPRHVVKGLVPIVAINGIHLLIDIGNE